MCISIQWTMYYIHACVYSHTDCACIVQLHAKCTFMQLCLRSPLCASLGNHGLLGGGQASKNDTTIACMSYFVFSPLFLLSKDLFNLIEMLHAL
jgi:hypothetical protein